MALQKPSLLQQFKEIIDENIKNGATTSEELRKGIPSSFTDADGVEYRLENVSRYYRTSTNKNVKTLNPTFLDVEKNKEVTAARANAIKMQTSPNVEKWNKKTDTVKGLEAHHKRMVKMYAPFYEGLNEKQAKELTQWFVDEGVPLGDAKTNLKNLSPKIHKEIHKWMIENNIQVSPDKTGKGNFVTQTKGKHKGKLLVKGSAESGVKAVMPSFKGIKGVNARLPLITNWLTYVQDPIDQKLSELEWDEYRRLHPPKPTDKLQVSEIAKELAEEKKLNMTGKHLSRALLANAAYSFVNPRSIKAATNMLVEGANKENIKEVGLGVRDDLIHTGVIKALGMATGAKALSIGGTVGAVPLGVGLVGGMTLNSIVEGATGKNLKEIGEQAEEKKLYREYHGLTNKKSDRQNYRHSTSPKVTQEMLEEWDTEIRQGWYEDSLEDRQLNRPLKETGKYLKAAQ